MRGSNGGGHGGGVLVGQRWRPLGSNVNGDELGFVEARQNSNYVKLGQR